MKTDIELTGNRDAWPGIIAQAFPTLPGISIKAGRFYRTDSMGYLVPIRNWRTFDFHVINNMRFTINGEHLKGCFPRVISRAAWSLVSKEAKQ